MNWIKRLFETPRDVNVYPYESLQKMTNINLITLLHDGRKIDLGTGNRAMLVLMERVLEKLEIRNE